MLPKRTMSESKRAKLSDANNGTSSEVISFVADVRHNRKIKIENFGNKHFLQTWVRTSPFIVNVHGEETEWRLEIKPSRGYIHISLVAMKGKFPIHAIASLHLIDKGERFSISYADADDFVFESMESSWVKKWEEKKKMQDLNDYLKEDDGLDCDSLLLELDLCIVGMAKAWKHLVNDQRALASLHTTGEASSVTDVTTSWEIISTESRVQHLRTVKIENISSKKELMQKGEYFDTGNFSINVHGNETEWCIRIYPKGKEDDDDFSIYLKLVKGSCEEHALQTFLVTQLKIVEIDGHSFRPMEFDLFIPLNEEIFLRSLNLREEVLENDTLTIELKLRILKVDEKTFSITGGLVPDKGSKEFQLSSMFNSEELSDCLIECGTKQFRCHKLILAGRSPVFQAMFRHNMTESLESKITIEDIDEATMEKALGYIYTGTVATLEDGTVSLLAAADKYDLGGLKALCEDSLAMTMNAGNVVDLLLLADKHNANLLKDYVIRYVSGSKTRISQNPENMEKLARNPKLMGELFSVAGF